MRKFGAFVLAGHIQAALVAMTLAFVALLFPLASLLSSALIAFVTLRQGTARGLSIVGIAAFSSGLLAYTLLSSFTPVLGFILALWLPAWILGSALRITRSLGGVVQLALSFGLLLIAMVYLQTGDPPAHWVGLLRPLAAEFVTAGLLDIANSTSFVEDAAHWMTGLLAGAFYLQLLLALLLARVWQAQLFNPGGFREEFYQLRASPWLGLIASLLLGWVSLQGATAPSLIRDLALLFLPLLLMLGLAIIHAVAAQARLATGWLVAVYGLLLLAFPQAEWLLALLGLADIFGDLRTRVASPPT